MFTEKDVANYYNTTQNHYEQWWNLKNNLSLHYGIWDEGINSFTESLINTNKVLMELSNISENDKVLDAGCGVGGAAMFLSEHKNAQVIGITLSEKQKEYADQKAKNKKLNDKVAFFVMNYTKTSFEDESFDVVWACESMSSAPDKRLFIDEVYRLLKKGGRLILSDFFITKDNQVDRHDWMRKWGQTWGISEFPSRNSFVDKIKTKGFNTVNTFDYTDKIKKSAKRMYYASILGMLPSETYNLLHPNVSSFAKIHYKCGYFQYKALKESLWKYNIILAEK